MGSRNHEISKSIDRLRSNNEAFIGKVKELVHQLENKKHFYLLSYFTYSFSISHQPEQESLCFGSCHLVNKGSVPVNNPYICIKISEKSPFTFSGKYTYEAPKQQAIKTPGGWLRMNDKSNKEEYWLKPLNVTTLLPDETVSFSNFQVKWRAEEDYAGSVMGFVYCDEIPEGAAVINPISLNGTTLKTEG